MMNSVEAITLQNSCCGCGACNNVCPVNAIKMTFSEEGFWTPLIDEKLCLYCGKCLSVCPIQNQEEIPKYSLMEMYGGYCTDEEMRAQSSSGGAFFALAKTVLKENGAVCGATIEKTDVFHKIITNIYELPLLFGSKYVQSDTAKVFSQIKERLESSDSPFLFCGTPCEVAGLKCYLQRDYNNLICVGFICHGVPSPKIWKEYITNVLEKKDYGKLRSINFRAKSQYGWHHFGLEIVGSKATTFCHARKDLFYNGFLENLYLNNSCYKCQLKGRKSVCDLLLADFWGAELYAPNLNTEENKYKGISLVTIFSPKGKKWFEKSENEFECIKVENECAYLNNDASVKPAERNPNTAAFYKYRKKCGTIKALNKFCRYTNIKKIKNLIRWHLLDVFRNKGKS